MFHEMVIDIIFSLLTLTPVSLGFFPMKLKSDVTQIFSSFLPFIKRLFNTKLVTLQTDGGGAFKPLTIICKQLGITHRFSWLVTHQQNNPIERNHCYIVEMGLTLLARFSLSFTYWVEAFEMIVYVIDLLPTSDLQNKSTYNLQKRYQL